MSNCYTFYVQWRLYIYRQIYIKELRFIPVVCLCCMWLSQLIEMFPLYTFKFLDFVVVTQSVLREVRTERLFIV